MVEIKNLFPWLGAILIIGSFVGFNVYKEKLYVSDYRALINSPELKNISVILLNETGKIETLVREPTVEFIRNRFLEDKVQTYFGIDLVDTSYLQIFEGTKGIWYNERKAVKFEIMNSSKVHIILEADYFNDSRHKNFKGNLIRDIEIYPGKNKEIFKFEPADDKKYIIKWIHETDDIGSSKVFKQASWNENDEKVNCEYTSKKNLKINWCDSKDKVSWATLYLNGKIIVSYRPVKGYQEIDPIIQYESPIKFLTASLIEAGESLTLCIYKTTCSGITKPEYNCTLGFLVVNKTVDCSLYECEYTWTNLTDTYWCKNQTDNDFEIRKQKVFDNPNPSLYENVGYRLNLSSIFPAAKLAYSDYKIPVMQ